MSTKDWADLENNRLGATCRAVPTHAALKNLIRLLAVAYIGQPGEPDRQRLVVIDEIFQGID